MPYTPMLSTIENLNQKNPLFGKHFELPIKVNFENEEDFFDTYTGWCRNNGYILHEQSDHYLGFAKRGKFNVGTYAISASWNDRIVYLYPFLTDVKYEKVINGDFDKRVNTMEESIVNLFNTLFDYLKIPKKVP